jgi:hypothetical protein
MKIIDGKIRTTKKEYLNLFEANMPDKITKKFQIRVKANTFYDCAYENGQLDELTKIIKALKKDVLGNESNKNEAWCYGVKAAIRYLKEMKP